MTKFGSNALLKYFNRIFLATLFASLIKVIEAMPGSVVPLAMFISLSFLDFQDFIINSLFILDL